MRGTGESSAEIHYVGNGCFGIFRQPCGASFGVFGDDGAACCHRCRTDLEQFDIGTQELWFDPFIVVDECQQRGLCFGDASIAGMRQAGLLFVDHAQMAGRMGRGECGESFGRIVVRAVVHYDALPFCRRQILHDDGL